MSRFLAAAMLIAPFVQGVFAHNAPSLNGLWKSYHGKKSLQLEGDGVFRLSDPDFDIKRNGNWTLSGKNITFDKTTCTFDYTPDDGRNNSILKISCGGNSFEDTWWKKIN